MKNQRYNVHWISEGLHHIWPCTLQTVAEAKKKECDEEDIKHGKEPSSWVTEGDETYIQTA